MAPLVPVDAPEPFSPALQRYLDSGPVGRADIVRWVGEPDVQRRDGRLLLWLAFRELSYTPPILMPRHTLVEQHVLIVSLDDAGEVAAHDVIINGGCSHRLGVCVKNAFQEAGSLRFYGDVDSFRLAMADLLTVLEAQPGPYPEGTPVPSGQCCITAYRGREAALSAVLRVQLPGLGARALPADGFLRWCLPAESLTVNAEWGVGAAGVQPKWRHTPIEVPCADQYDVYLRFDFERGGIRPMVIKYTWVDAAEARDALMNRRRVLLE